MHLRLTKGLTAQHQSNNQPFDGRKDTNDNHACHKGVVNLTVDDVPPWIVLVEKANEVLPIGPMPYIALVAF